MSFSIVPYNDELAYEWNEFLHRSKNGTFQFDRNYMEYHSTRFKDSSILVYKGSKIVALFPANVHNNIVYSHEGLTFGGLIYTNRIKIAEVIEILKAVMIYYKSKGFHQILYKTIPYVFSNYPAEEDRYALFQINAKLYRRDVFSIVQFENAIDFDSSKKNHIKHCEKEGLTWKESDNFSDYWNLLTSVLERHHASPVHHLDEILMLKSRFPQNIKLFSAEINSELLAGIVIYDYGQIVHTQYMANSAEGRKIGALDYLNYHLMYEYFKERKYYSFGTSNENEGKILNEGLSLQKEQMGGRAVAHDFYKIDLI